jgi:glycosyltransferase involved in cell wall biosynthesis
LSVVVPVYGIEATLPELVDRLGSLAERLPGKLEAVFVVDGSPDGSLAVLERILPDSPLASQVVVHSRNFGFAGLLRSLPQAQQQGHPSPRGRRVCLHP